MDMELINSLIKQLYRLHRLTIWEFYHNRCVFLCDGSNVVFIRCDLPIGTIVISNHLRLQILFLIRDFLPMIFTNNFLKFMCNRKMISIVLSISNIYEKICDVFFYFFFHLFLILAWQISIDITGTDWLSYQHARWKIMIIYQHAW